MGGLSVQSSDASSGKLKTRFLGYDVARTLAVFGMLPVNFRIATESYEGGPEWLAWTLDMLVGRAATLFVVLAGIGLSLMARSCGDGHGRLNIAGVRRRLFKRSFFLFPMGLVLMHWWSADILHFYGLFLLIGALMLEISDRGLLWTAGMFGVVSVAVMNISEETLFSDLMIPPLPLPIQPAWLIDDLLVTGIYPVFPWAGFFLLGMWLGRQDMTDAAFRQRLVRNGLITLCLAGGLAVMGERLFLESVLNADETDSVYWFEMQAFPNTPFFTISSAAGALIVIALCVQLAERYGRNAFVVALARTGRMSMTLYVGHLVFALSWLSHLADFPEAPKTLDVLVYSVGFFAAALVFSQGWLHYFSYGPLEWAMRRFSSPRNTFSAEKRNYHRSVP